MKFFVITVLALGVSHAVFASLPKEIYHKTCEITPYTHPSFGRTSRLLSISQKKVDRFQKKLFDKFETHGYILADQDREGQLRVKATVTEYVRSNTVEGAWEPILNIWFVENNDNIILAERRNEKFSYFLNGYNRAGELVLESIPRCVVIK